MLFGPRKRKLIAVGIGVRSNATGGWECVELRKLRFSLRGGTDVWCALLAKTVPLVLIRLGKL